jgi:hypothetical protein
MEYLKNTVLKLFMSGEAEALLPVFAALLSFSPEDMSKAKKVRGWPKGRDGKNTYQKGRNA